MTTSEVCEADGQLTLNVVLQVRVLRKTTEDVAYDRVAANVLRLQLCRR